MQSFSGSMFLRTHTAGLHADKKQFIVVLNGMEAWGIQLRVHLPSYGFQPERAQKTWFHTLRKIISDIFFITLIHSTWDPFYANINTFSSIFCPYLRQSWKHFVHKFVRFNFDVSLKIVKFLFNSKFVFQWKPQILIKPDRQFILIS